MCWEGVEIDGAWACRVLRRAVCAVVRGHWLPSESKPAHKRLLFLIFAKKLPFVRVFWARPSGWCSGETVESELTDEYVAVRWLSLVPMGICARPGAGNYGKG